MRVRKSETTSVSTLKLGVVLPPLPPSALLRTGFDKLRANGKRGDRQGPFVLSPVEV